MKDVGRSLNAIVCGVVTSALIAIVVFGVSEYTGLNIYSFSVLVVVPIGAFFTGLAAASGYFIGGIYFHKRPGLLFLFQMIIVACLTQILIYYMGYYTLVLENGGRVSELISFREYVSTYLTSATYRVGRALRETPEVGSLGYWLAAFQFVGFLAAYLVVWGVLKLQPVCPRCKQCLRNLSTRVHTFASADLAMAHYEALVRHPAAHPAFAALIRFDAQADPQKGAVKITTVLEGCPNCKSQFVKGTVEVNDGSQWKPVHELDRRIAVPNGVNLVSVFADGTAH